MKTFGVNVLASLVGFMLTLAAVGGAALHHRRQVRTIAEAGLLREIRENNDGVQELRGALPAEMKNISDLAELLKQREASRQTDGQVVQIGLSVMSLTDANWRAAAATGALESLDYGSVERFSAAYFEQARLAQLQVTTLDAMMALSSYVGHGEQVGSLTPEQARAAEIQARLLFAHLRMMSRMSDGVQGAYKDALAGTV
ncbi:MAG: hypothetical protein HIU87_12860 [Acidobacteria bacterium]|nr:hypothetical protein [Acidobacteriota bacterium]